MKLTISPVSEDTEQKKKNKNQFLGLNANGFLSYVSIFYDRKFESHTETYFILKYATRGVVPISNPAEKRETTRRTPVVFAIILYLWQTFLFFISSGVDTQTDIFYYVGVPWHYNRTRNGQKIIARRGCEIGEI